MLIVGVIGRLPSRLLALTGLLFMLFVLQYVFLYVLGNITGVPALRALHAVNALLLFWIAVQVIQRAWLFIRSSQRVS